ncbi:toprim domain-containing protein [Stutzerimonas kunmingensis]|jgi:putative DNA primase/helicase|uniref:toprim domain-containing protein n=2 Tax=Stutzerimonas kunmingensis TaxID=1211807 RepID=UPI000C3E80AB|nr:topoisomerase [Pseudomonas sp.]HCH78483.1 topoisomerase [Pseudomonas sp.]|tara:strand:- start:10498 stop:11406 length:909 start_codon:yes stop_codon:yes gene_type:complete
MGLALSFTPFAVSDAVMLFRDKLAAAYGAMDWLPIPDGQIHRFHVPGDKVGTHNGWYVLFGDGIVSGCFGSWKAGSSYTWSSRKPCNMLEAEHLRQRIEQGRRQREAEQHRRQQAAAEKAARLWRDARRAAHDHPYLIAKGCRAHNLRQAGDVLLVPLTCGGLLVNLQRIAPDGTKRFLSGGMVKGCYSSLGAIASGQPLFLCEGWSTGATIHEHHGAAVACAMNAGNLLEAGRQLQRAYPDSQLIVAGDDDRMTEGNPGRTAANRAAALLGCDVEFPRWSGAEPLEMSDFNDLRQWLRANQ